MFARPCRPDLLAAAPACPVESARLSVGLADLGGPRGLGGEAVALGGTRGGRAVGGRGLRGGGGGRRRARGVGPGHRRVHAVAPGRAPVGRGWWLSGARGSTSRAGIRPAALRSSLGWWTSPAASRAPSRDRGAARLRGRRRAAGAGRSARGPPDRGRVGGPRLTGRPQRPCRARPPASPTSSLPRPTSVAHPGGPSRRARGRGAAGRRVVGLGGRHPRHPGLVAAGGRQPVRPHHRCPADGGGARAARRRRRAGPDRGTARRRAPRPRRPGAAGRPQPGRDRRGGARGRCRLPAARTG